MLVVVLQLMLSSLQFGKWPLSTTLGSIFRPKRIPAAAVKLFRPTCVCEQYYFKFFSCLITHVMVLQLHNMHYIYSFKSCQNS